MSDPLVIKASDWARIQLDGQLRDNGHPFMEHVDAVAKIVETEIGLSSMAVAAVYLHEATRKCPQDMEYVRKEFGTDMERLVAGLNRISTINPKDTRLEADNYRKLIVSYSTDPQVTLIKLADRLEVMRSLETCFPKSKHIQKATETFLLYAPLAHQLGLYRIKSQMEDLAFKVTQPEQYRLITNKLTVTELEGKQQIARFVHPLEEELKSAGISYELKSRAKATYSIWRKMQAQKVDVDEVYDILAIRFIIDAPPETEKELCWQVYSLVTHIYEPIAERMRDWITVPKSSGYESLHTTVKIPGGGVVEVQIRSRRMDAVAEYGVAAHWAYKGVRNEEVLKQWLNGVRARLQDPSTGFASEESRLDKAAFEEVFVFTPTGELRKLPLGATVLDYAFDIHTNLGLRCTGGRINGRMAQLRDRLQTGDVVEILTSKNQKPSADWVNFVVSTKAKNKIRQKLREEAGVQDAAGREILKRRLKNWKIDPTADQLNALMKRYKYKQLSDFYAAVASQTIPLQEIKDFLEKEAKPLDAPVTRPAAVETPLAERTAPAKEGNGDYLIIDDKPGRFGFKLAKCCNPIIGDPIFGFISIKDGVKIHRLSCPNAQRLMTMYPYRIQKVKWRNTSATLSFQVAIRFSAYDEMGIAQEIGQAITALSLNLRNFTFANQHGKIEGRLQVAVNSNKQVDLLLFQLKKIKGMVKVTRE